MDTQDQGITSDRYAIIPRVLIFITRGEEVLLIKGAPHKRLWANQYNGIGGHVERGEDLLSAAYRELTEETGLLPHQLTPPGLYLCGSVIVDAGQSIGVGVFIFRAALNQEHVYAQLSPSPEGSLEWIDPTQLAGLPCLEDLPYLLPRVLAQASTDPPFSARSYYNVNGKLEIVFST